MGETSIEWTDRVWNPTTGCDQISPGCDNCYALTLAKRLKGMGQPKYQADGDPRTSGPGFGLTLHPDTLDQPLRWRKPSRVFVNSMSDLFHKDVPYRFIRQVFDVMRVCDGLVQAGSGRRYPSHTFQVLTKRSQRMADLANTRALGYSPLAPPSNVWLGTSIESDRYCFRADHIRATPAAVRWLSLEPLLGPLPSLSLEGIGWVVVGGESGPGARPMHPDWARDIRDRCLAAGVPFFFKQWGEWMPDPDEGRGWEAPPGSRRRSRDRAKCFISVGADGVHVTPGPAFGEASVPLVRVGKKAAGRVLDGRTWDQYPEAVTR